MRCGRQRRRQACPAHFAADDLEIPVRMASNCGACLHRRGGWMETDPERSVGLVKNYGAALINVN